MGRGHLQQLDAKTAFHTSPRFDLLASDHVAFPALGAPDVEQALRAAIESEEGVVAVVGRIGAGKSSLIANVLAALDDRFVVLPVSVYGDEARDPTSFARHALREIEQVPDTQFGQRERTSMRRASAEERTVTSTGERSAGGRLRVGRLVAAEVVADIKKITAEQLRHTNDATIPMTALREVLKTLWAAGRCPVMVLNDTDHWDAKPDVADGFFDQTARALSQRDLVVVVAAQTEYTRLPGYLAMKQMLREVELPELSEPSVGIAKILQHRIDRERVDCRVDEIVEPAALALAADAYSASAEEGRGGDLRRTIVVIGDALATALNEPGCERIAVRHVQEALSRNPLTRARILKLRSNAS